ncbi:hypothetical protein HYC85_012310 [Camellia sinensis]|uniref:Syntaxin N-terminal domain-containing protein n=1 Tax=Camellia sinensis TaxID=4442 RepID=A0A7J7HCU2_CAMSI|nr:hypothetical protein HYC85_012310 [Camellia sinensis]
MTQFGWPATVVRLCGESGGGGIINETIDLDRFFEDVVVKYDMKDVERLNKNLQESNEESKMVHNAKTMKELRSGMDVDIAQVLKRVKVIKGKLEALERSNAAHRSNPGCGPGSLRKKMPQISRSLSRFSSVIP